MKKLINDPADVVRESLQGFAAAHADLVRVNADPAYVVRADAPVSGKVGILSGGGSGHEPMHGGFVGRGMLDVACPGEVFTSPTPDQMLDATKAVDGGAGVLHIVKNYTGDILNFEMAADLAKGDGIEVEAVITNDDVAVQDSLYTAGRRGVGVTVLCEKIVGAAAEEGKDLATVAELCRRVNAEGRSMGMALTSCGPRAIAAGACPRGGRAPDDADPRGPPVRVGRQGAGVRQRYGRNAADRAVRGLQRAEEPAGSSGYRDRPQPRRLVHHVARDGGLLDHPAATRRRVDSTLGRTGAHRGPAVGRVSTEITVADVSAWVRAFAAAVAEQKEALTALDQAIGDGDHGINMHRGMSAVIEKLDAAPSEDVSGLMKTIGMTLISKVGGAAGPLYGTFFLQFATAATGTLTPEGFAACFASGVTGVRARGKAELEDKTMIDALQPAADALSAAARNGTPFADALGAAADAADAGVTATIPLVARKGRASYLGERSAGHQDPGATSSALLVRCAARTWAT
jgi:dihydroxyacetone kinase phosphoprotein-dependent L subunit